MPLLNQLISLFQNALNWLLNLVETIPLTLEWSWWGGFAILAFIVITVVVIEACFRWVFK